MEIFGVGLPKLAVLTLKRLQFYAPRRILVAVIQNHSNRTGPNLRSKLGRRLACHGSLLSGVEAFGKPGAVHIASGLGNRRRRNDQSP